MCACALNFSYFHLHVADKLRSSQSAPWKPLVEPGRFPDTLKVLPVGDLSYAHGFYIS